MIFPISSLLDNIPQDLQKVIAQRDREYQFQITFLEEQVQLLQDKLYGRKAEKLPASKYPQMLIFDEAEDILVTPQENEKEDQITISKHMRKKPGKRPLPENLPRIEVIHDLSEEEKKCSCGCQMNKIGEEVSEKLDIIPATFRYLQLFCIRLFYNSPNHFFYKHRISWNKSTLIISGCTDPNNPPQYI